MRQIDGRLTCLTYVVACIYTIDYLLVMLGWKSAFFELSYGRLIYLVGGLHFMEGILTLFFGDKKTQAVVKYRGKEIAGGYRAYGKWLIPLLFFSFRGIYVPIVAAIVYFNETFVMSPKEKSKKMGLLIGSFGLLILAIGFLVEKGLLALTTGIWLMPIFHELLFWIDNTLEKGPLKYTYPALGIRVIDILGNNALDIRRGDIIIALNQKVLMEESSYYDELHQGIKASGGNEKIMIKIKREVEEKKGFLGMKKVTPNISNKENIEELVCTVAELRGMKLVFLPPY